MIRFGPTMRKLINIFFFLAIAYSSHAADKPNIILFFVDDLGWSDLGYRNPVFESPNIDTLAREGLSFEQAYIASPTCSPSRATLLTGKSARPITGIPVPTIRRTSKTQLS